MAEQALLEQFFYKPMSRFGIRELSRQTGTDTKTVMKYLKEFVKQKIIIKKAEKGTFPHYEANRLSTFYKYKKSHGLITRLIESGVVEFLEQQLQPKAIVLFGSAAKGTYHEKSDIDIFIYGAQKKTDLKKYEQKLGHKIQLLFENDLKQLTPGLLENIYNGEILSGKLEVVR